MMKLLRLAAVLMLAVFSFSVTADTDVLSLKSEGVAPAKLKLTDNKTFSAAECTDTETVPCSAKTNPPIVVSMTNWPDPPPVPAVTASNSITRDSCHMIEVSSVVPLQPG